MVLGFDASTTCAGWAIYDGKDIVDAGFIDISKINSNKEKSLHIISIIDQSSYISEVKQINLEVALLGFKFGRTNQQTIIKLIRFNAVFEYIISEHWKIPVNLIGASTARKKVFGKARITGMNGKEFVRKQIDELFPQLHKFDKINSRGNPDSKNGDMYDAMITSMA